MAKKRIPSKNTDAPVFNTHKRYVNSKGQKFGKGVWEGYGHVISPGWGDFSRKNKTVTQYNTDGSKTVYSWKEWQDKKTKEHEYKVLQNDKKYAIPYVPEKKMTITIDNNPKSRNNGATFSENVLDSIAVNAKKAGLPFSTALGIASQESTIGSNPKRSVGRSMQPALYSMNLNPKFKQAGSKITYPNEYSPSMLISNWKRIAESPFAEYQYDGKGYLLKEAKNEEYYDEYFNPALRESNNYEIEDVSPLYHGFKSYKEDPTKYNRGDPNYPKKVEKQSTELVNHSPEIKAYMKKHNLHSDGGSLDDNYWDYLPLKEKAEMMRVAINNGITTLPEIRQAYNKFAKGGKMNGWTMEDEAGYRYWRSRLPKNLRDTDDKIYDMRGAYKAGMQPMWNEEDKSYHLQSRDPQSGRIFKSPLHSTYLKALMEDASMGYYPIVDNKGNTYTKTWPGNTLYEKEEPEVPFKAYGGNLFGDGGDTRQPSNSERAMSYLMSRGMSNTGAAAIVGTLQAESGLNPAIHARMKGDDGEGLAQWTGSRKKNFWKTLETIEPGAQKKYGSIVNVPLERQLDVVLAERPTVTAAIHNAKDINTATDIMLRGYENGGGAAHNLASVNQMNNIYGKWNNGYDNQMKVRLGNANKLLGLEIDPSTYQISQGFFDDINAQISNLPEVQLPDEMTTDPTLRYNVPTIDETLLRQPKEEPTTVEQVYDPRQERLEGLQNFNTIMGMMGAETPLTGLVGSGSSGLFDAINKIYS